MIILLLPHFQQIHTLNPTLTVPNALRARRSQPITIQREQYKRLTRPGGDVFQSVQQIKKFFFFFFWLWLVGWGGWIPHDFKGSRFSTVDFMGCYWLYHYLLYLVPVTMGLGAITPSSGLFQRHWSKQREKISWNQPGEPPAPCGGTSRHRIDMFCGNKSPWKQTDPKPSGVAPSEENKNSHYFKGLKKASRRLTKSFIRQKG